MKEKQKNVKRRTPIIPRGPALTGRTNQAAPGGRTEDRVHSPTLGSEQDNSFEGAQSATEREKETEMKELLEKIAAIRKTVRTKVTGGMETHEAQDIVRDIAVALDDLELDIRKQFQQTPGKPEESAEANGKARR